jgi:signal transduction histidine kinase
VALFTVLAVLLLWGLTLQLQGQLREQVLDRAQIRSQQLADAMAGQVGARLAQLDLGLLDLRVRWGEPLAEFKEAEQRLLQALPEGLVSHLSVVNADGVIVYNSLGQPAGTFVGDRPHFQMLRQGGDRLVVGEPVRSRLNGQWLMVVGRPLQSDGAFAGAIHLNVSTDHLAGLLGRLVLSEGDLVGLVHPSGKFLARSLDNEAAMGHALPSDRPFLEDRQALRGSFRLGGAVDGVPRLFGWQRLPESGIVVVVGLSVAGVLEPLRQPNRRALMLTAVLALTLGAIGAWIGALLWKLERSRDQGTRSEQRLKSAQRMARLGHWEFEPVSGRLEWSDEVYRIFGRNAHGFVPSEQAYLESVHPDDMPTLRGAFDQAKMRRTPMDVVHRIRRPDASERHVRLLCEMDFVGDQVVRFHGTVQDITELRETQRALEDLNAELDQRVKARTRALVGLNRELESFTYSVSHDLRTPLRSIHGFASLLRESDEPRLSPEGRDALHRILDSARRMGLLINDLLSMAQQSRAELKAERIHLSELARTVAQELANGHEERCVQWRIEEGLWVTADPSLMRVVMQNLLGNAWKYTGRTPEALIELFRVEGEEGMVSFCVRDNGAGFDMRYADQLFHPFKRLHRQDEFEGTGVGLASVQRILQRHGGSVRGEGRPGQGASFFFSLPVVALRHFMDSAG